MRSRTSARAFSAFTMSSNSSYSISIFIDLPLVFFGAPISWLWPICPRRQDVGALAAVHCLFELGLGPDQSVEAHDLGRENEHPLGGVGFRTLWALGHHPLWPLALAIAARAWLTTSAFSPRAV